MTLLAHGNLILTGVGQVKRLTKKAAIDIGISAQAKLTGGHEGRNLRTNGTVLIKELLGSVRLKPIAQNLEVSLGITSRRQRHLVRTP